ncbi:MAG: ATP-binding protein [Gammaproteobacteria bacterium]
MVSWQENAATGSDQWMLCVQDSGPGFREGSEHTVSGALQHATAESHEVDQRAESTADPAARVESLPLLASRSPARAGYDLPGEGIGLSIVKRLCELLDAGMEIESAAGRGTTIRVTFPRVYLA